MTQPKHSLTSLRHGNYEVMVLILASLVTLIFGLSLPVITFKEMVFWKHTFSIVTGIKNLYDEHYYLLAAIIFIFSILFPFFKLTTLFVLWFYRMTAQRRAFFLKWLGMLGKWSMLDVFVVAVTIVISKMSALTKAEPRPGIYVFGVSVLLSMLATVRMEQLARKTDPR